MQMVLQECLREVIPGIETENIEKAADLLDSYQDVQEWVAVLEVTHEPDMDGRMVLWRRYCSIIVFICGTTRFLNMR